MTVTTPPALRHWHVGHNTPGYLPDNPAECFSGSRDEAAALVFAEAAKAWELAFEAHCVECRQCAEAEESSWGDDCLTAPYLHSYCGINARADGALEISLLRVGEHDLDEAFFAAAVEPEAGCDAG